MVKMKNIVRDDKLIICDYQFDGLGAWGKLSYSKETGEVQRSPFAEGDDAGEENYIKHAIRALLSANVNKTEITTIWY